MLTVNGDPMEWTDGMTVAEVLERRRYVFRMIVVTINGEHVKRADYPTTRIPDGADVQVLHMMSGG